MPDQLLRDVQSFEAELGLPQGFYLKLFDEDDWSFVIKLNALFEAACTHALVARLRAPEIESQLAHLELAGSDTGKVKFLSALGAITPEQASYLRKLAELPDGHPKLLHLWPVKLLQAGPRDCRSFLPFS